MTSQEAKQLCGGFLLQLRGIFAGIEKLPLAFEELEAKEAFIPALNARIKDLNLQVTQATQEFARVDEAVRVKREAAQAQQQKVLVAALASLHGQINDEEAKLAGVKAELEAVTQELREKQSLLASFKA